MPTLPNLPERDNYNPVSPGVNTNLGFLTCYNLTTYGFAPDGYIPPRSAMFSILLWKVIEWVRPAVPDESGKTAGR